MRARVWGPLPPTRVWGPLPPPHTSESASFGGPPPTAGRPLLARWNEGQAARERRGAEGEWPADTRYSEGRLGGERVGVGDVFPPAHRVEEGVVVALAAERAGGGAAAVDAQARGGEGEFGEAGMSGRPARAARAVAHPRLDHLHAPGSGLSVWS